MKRDQTIAAFADEYMKLAEEVPLSKISVSMITSACGMSRKSFYYYFSDRESLVNWIFRNDLSCSLTELGHDTHAWIVDDSGMPFYPELDNERFEFDHYAFLQALERTFSKHAKFYWKALHETQPGNLGSYICSLYSPVMTEIVKSKHAIGCPTASSCKLVAEMYLNALVVFTRDHILEINEANRQDYLDAVLSMATACFASKYLRRAS